MKSFIRLTGIFITLLCFKYTSAQITIQLYQEDFNSPSNSFVLNSGGPASNTGNNKWIVNNQYNGNGIYPNTPDQNQVAGGTISQAPTSNYLHIHDANSAPGTSNANYNTSNASDNFAQMGTSFCTVGLINIHLAFFWIGEGSPTDYGRLYYSINGGTSWTQIGKPQYNGSNLWRYEDVTDPAFENQNDLRFGWRWTNSGAGGANKISFGVDDIFVVGTYDNVNNPVQINISSVAPSPVCQGDNISVSIQLSRPLCAGNYQMEISNASGNFSGNMLPYIFYIGTGQTNSFQMAGVPSSLTPGTCYKIRMSRMSPPPQITGSASICFEVKKCPNTIKTLQPVVTKGPDTVCVNSVIEVPFFSTGAYLSSNKYIAQLSDANGNFTTPSIIGTSPDANTYDPNLGSPPGTVSGKVPVVPAGCGYYIRVISTNPVATSSAPADYFGPFCIKRCDMETNDMEDVQLCITDTSGADTTITVTINNLGNKSTYAAGNEFKIQVINSKTYAIINTGVFGKVTATSNGSLTISVPNYPDLLKVLPYPGTGTYYMRLIATNSSNPGDTLGTLVHLTIGKIAPPPVVGIEDSVICAGDVADFYIWPFNFNSAYQWQSPILNFGDPLDWYDPDILITFPKSFKPGKYPFNARENNNGCFSPWSDTVWVNILTTPQTTITGPSPVCQGDTVKFKVPFIDKTYYDWDNSWKSKSNKAVELDKSNNEYTLIFDSTGNINISVTALNQCGQANGNKTVTVQPKPTVNAGNDTAVCEGQSATLIATGINATAYSWSESGAIISSNQTVTVTPAKVSDYIITASNSIGCKNYDTVMVSVHQLPVLTVTQNDITCFGADNGSVTAIVSSGTQPYTYEWDTDPVQTTASANNLSPGVYLITVTDNYGCTADTGAIIAEPGPLALNFEITGVTYGASDGTAAVNVEGGKAPFSFLWSTDPVQNSQMANNLAIGTYSVIVTDAGGCTQEGVVEIMSKENALYIPNAFSPNNDGINDDFNFYGTNLKDIYIAIYNRWGERIFESDNMNKRWDGRFNNQLEQAGAYAYYIIANFQDDTQQIRKGTITLIK